MPWFKVDDGLHSSRKVLSIPKRARFAAIGLWSVAGSWCADQLTDGVVPEYMLSVWGAPPSAPQSLVDAGLWERESGSYVFCNWVEYQPAKQDVDAERASHRARMRDLRAKRKQEKGRNSGDKPVVCDSTGAHGAEMVPDPVPIPSQSHPDPTHKREASQAPQPTKGRRLPNNWMPTQSVIDAMTNECPNIDQPTEHRKFVDHWKAQPGAKGVKVDWDATYRNWVRRAAQFAPKKGVTTMDKVANTASIAHRLQQQADQQEQLQIGNQ